MKQINTYSIFSIDFWRAYLIQMRPYLFFISGVAGMAGIATWSSFNLTAWHTPIMFLPFFLAYGFGQALTDCFQIDTDTISAPYRPLSQRVVTPKQVGIVSMFGLSFCLGILIYFNKWNALFGFLSIIGLASYSVIKRRFWFAGPFYNSWIVALLPIMGYLVISGSSFDSINNSKLITVVLLNFFAYANFVLMGYLKDITADRKTSYQTFPVVFGWDATVWVGDILAGISTFICLQLATVNFISISFFAMATGLAITGQLYAHFTKVKKDWNATIPITMTIRSFVLWNLAVVLSFHSTLIFFILGYYILFEITLARRPMKAQI